MLRPQGQAFLVKGQRTRQRAAGVVDRTAQVQRVGGLRLQRQRPLGRRLGFSGLLGAQAQRHFRQPAFDAARVDRAGILQQAQAVLGAAGVQRRRGLQHQQCEARRGWQFGIGEARLLQQLLRTGLSQYGLGQRLHDLGAVHPQPQCLFESRLGLGQLRLGQQGAAEQHLHRQQLAVDRQRLTELHDGAAEVLLLVALERRFVQTRGLRVCRRRRRAGQQQGQSQGQTTQGGARPPAGRGRGGGHPHMLGAGAAARRAGCRALASQGRAACVICMPDGALDAMSGGAAQLAAAPRPKAHPP